MRKITKMEDLLKDGNGVEMEEGSRLIGYELDGTLVCGTLKRGETYRGPNDWFVSWDDGEETVVIEPGLLFKL